MVGSIQNAKCKWKISNKGRQEEVGFVVALRVFESIGLKGQLKGYAEYMLCRRISDKWRRFVVSINFFAALRGPSPTLPLSGRGQTFEFTGDSCVPAGGSCVPAGGSCVPAGGSCVPAGGSWVPAGGNCVPAGEIFIPEGGNCVPAGEIFIPAGENCVPAGENCVPAGEIFIPAGGNCVPAGENCIPAGEN